MQGLYSLSRKRVEINPVLTRAAGVLLFLVLTCCGAFVYIPLPFTPVPLTLQTFFVILSGVFLKPKEAFTSQALYLGLGAAGIPVFTGGIGGLARLVGPTGGYILGFVGAAVLVSFLMKRVSIKEKPGFPLILGIMLCGLGVIYFFGWLRLSVYLGNRPVSAFTLGVLPFLSGGVMKAVAAAGIWRFTRNKEGL